MTEEFTQGTDGTFAKINKGAKCECGELSHKIYNSHKLYMYDLCPACDKKIEGPKFIKNGLVNSISNDYTMSKSLWYDMYTNKYPEEKIYFDMENYSKIWAQFGDLNLYYKSDIRAATNE